MVSINWQLTLIAIVALPAFAFPILRFGRRRYNAMERAQEALGELSVMLEETLSLSGAIVIKSFGTEEREARHFDEINASVRNEQIAQLLEGQWLAVVIQSLSALGPALLFARLSSRATHSGSTGKTHRGKDRNRHRASALHDPARRPDTCRSARPDRRTRNAPNAITAIRAVSDPLRSAIRLTRGVNNSRYGTFLW